MKNRKSRKFKESVQQAAAESVQTDFNAGEKGDPPDQSVEEFSLPLSDKGRTSDAYPETFCFALRSARSILSVP